jgi:hypothetical protein
MHKLVLLISLPFALSFLVGMTYWAFSYYFLNIFDFGSMQGFVLLRGSLAFMILWISSVLGVYAAGSTKNLRLVRRRISAKLVFLGSFLLFFILFGDFIFRFISSLYSGHGFVISDRQYINNVSMLKIGLLVLSAWYIRRLQFLPVSLCLFGVLLVFLDVSREAAVPAFFAALISPSPMQRFISIISLLFIVVYSMYARDFSAISILLLSSYFFEGANYFFGMNFLHFSDAIGRLSDRGTDFSLSLFWQSVVPLPGGLVSAVELDGRNLDAYRPIGAAADLVLWNWFAALLVFFSYGFVFGLGFLARSRLLFIFAVMFSFVCFSWLFQYHLRTSAKYIIIFGLIFLMSRRGLLRVGWRQW